MQAFDPAFDPRTDRHVLPAVDLTHVLAIHGNGVGDHGVVTRGSSSGLGGEPQAMTSKAVRR